MFIIGIMSLSNEEFNFVAEYEQLCRKYEMVVDYGDSVDGCVDIGIPSRIYHPSEREMDNHIGDLLGE